MPGEEEAGLGFPVLPESGVQVAVEMREMMVGQRLQTELQTLVVVVVLVMEHLIEMVLPVVRAL
jgi:hypothetical protein